MIAYKLLRVRQDGSLGPLFINRSQRLHCGQWYVAQALPTKGYAYRPGWHCCSRPQAPHLSKHGRVWFKVAVQQPTPWQRPKAQGGLWYTARRMKILECLEPKRLLSFLPGG